MTDLDIFQPKKPTEEDLRQKFIAALAALSVTPAELADYMKKIGDYRDFNATTRSIQRMVSGESRVSGEVMVIVNMLLRRHRRLKEQHPNIEWTVGADGVHRAQVMGWYLYIQPRRTSPSRPTRYILSCSTGPGPKDFSPEFGRWLDSLEEAKNKALVVIEEGMNDLATFHHEEAERERHRNA
jgi:hypothetical protein